MDYDSKSRRLFLRGLGGFTLALPFLPSMIPARAYGQSNGEAPKRFVAICTYDGYYENMYYPSQEPNQRFADDVYYQSLASIQGGLSELLGTQFDSVRSKMNIYRGLDIVGKMGHSAPAMLTAAERILAGDNSPLETVGKSLSMDVALSKSSNFYPKTPKFMALRGQEPSYEYGMSFDRDINNKFIRLPYIKYPRDMFNQVFNLGNTITNPNVQNQINQKKLLVGDLVNSQIQSLKSNRRISLEDKSTLDSFINQTHELHKKMNTLFDPNVCTKPTIAAHQEYWDLMSESQKDAFFDSYVDIMVNAMACDLTRISIISLRLHGHDHALSHASTKDRSNQLKYIANTQKIIKVVKRFVDRMDGITDANGKTMLDNSIVYWGSEDANGAPHTCMSMPAISFGGAGGNIKTGYYVDYRQRPFFLHPDGQNLGRSYSQLLITFMRALGLQPQDYMAYGDGGGFGSFNRDLQYTNQRYYPYEKFRNNTLPFVGLV